MKREAEDTEELEDARTEIDRVDTELLRMLAERMELVRKVGEVKGRSAEAALLDPERERSILAKWTKTAEAAGLSGHFAGRILREILAHSRRTQEAHLDPDRAAGAGARTLRVGYQGEPGAYSELAAAKLFATRNSGTTEREGFRTFAATIDALHQERIDYALLPIENSIAGGIADVNRLLVDSGLMIVDEEVWEVEHVLAALPGAELAAIARVRSHAAALAQCGVFLRRLRDVVVEPWFDTAGAAESVARAGDTRIAAIASEEAAAAHGLVVLERNIADEDRNVTRFILIGREEELPPRSVPAKTSLLVLLDHSEGALARCLAAFEHESINLTRIESRPQPRTPWQYLFFIDVEGHRLDEALERALAKARSGCNLLRVLGTYPMRTKQPAHLDVGVSLPEGDGAPSEPAPVACTVTPAGSLTAMQEGRTRTIIDVGGVRIGGDRFTLISGPCAVESREQILEAAGMVRKRGAVMLRGGAFKPRSSPYSFQGLGHEGLALLREAGRAFELPVVTEVLRIEDIPAVVAAADVVQVGARNMQNFALLRELGRISRPVLLKRGMSSTVKELLMAAEYIMAGGNQQVILCERGIRTFETSTRNTLDLGAVAVLKACTHLPVIVDPSHAAGVRHLVVPLALAAAAVGADGLIVEAHPHPEEALCDKEQALTGEDLDRLVRGLVPILASQGRTM